MKIRRVGVEVVHADGRKNRQANGHDEADSRLSPVLQTRLKMPAHL